MGGRSLSSCRRDRDCPDDQWQVVWWHCHWPGSVYFLEGKHGIGHSLSAQVVGGGLFTCPVVEHRVRCNGVGDDDIAAQSGSQTGILGGNTLCARMMAANGVLVHYLAIVLDLLLCQS